MGTWYECTKVDVKVQKGENSINPDIEVICRIQRIDDDAELLDESDFAVIYQESYFEM